MFWNRKNEGGGITATYQLVNPSPKYYNVRVKFAKDCPLGVGVFLDLVLSVDILDGGELEICRHNEATVVYAEGTWISYEMEP